LEATSQPSFAQAVAAAQAGDPVGFLNAVTGGMITKAVSGYAGMVQAATGHPNFLQAVAAAQKGDVGGFLSAVTGGLLTSQAGGSLVGLLQSVKTGSGVGIFTNLANLVPGLGGLGQAVGAAVAGNAGAFLNIVSGGALQGLLGAGLTAVAGPLGPVLAQVAGPLLTQAAGGVLDVGAKAVGSVLSAPGKLLEALAGPVLPSPAQIVHTAQQSALAVPTPVPVLPGALGLLPDLLGRGPEPALAAVGTAAPITIHNEIHVHVQGDKDAYQTAQIVGSVLEERLSQLFVNGLNSVRDRREAREQFTPMAE